MSVITQAQAAAERLSYSTKDVRDDLSALQDRMDLAVGRLLVGTTWETEEGISWYVVAYDSQRPGYVKVMRLFHGASYWWHIKSLLETTMRRVPCAV